MKILNYLWKPRFAFLLIVLLFSSAMNISHADVMPDNSHVLDRCVKVVNLDDFPDIYLIAYVTGPMIDGNESSIIQQDVCLTKGYKFNTFQILSATKAYIDSIGIDAVDTNNKSIYNLNVDIEPYGGYVDDSNPLIKEEIEYTLIQLSDTTFTLYKSKQTSTYNDGTPTQIETFPGPDNFFRDVPSSHQNYAAINYLYQKGIIQGYPDGTYKPGNIITRAEFTKIAIKSKFDDTEIDNCITQNIQPNLLFVFFPDVRRNQWFAKYICVAKENGIVKGYNDGKYRPGNDISFVEAAKILVETFNYDIGIDEPWYKPYVDVLAQKQAIPDSIFRFAQKITRGEMAEIMRRLMEEVTTQLSKTYMDLNQ
jgi:hypothetical protein